MTLEILIQSSDLVSSPPASNLDCTESVDLLQNTGQALLSSCKHVGTEPTTHKIQRYQPVLACDQIRKVVDIGGPAARMSHAVQYEFSTPKAAYWNPGMDQNRP